MATAYAPSEKEAPNDAKDPSSCRAARSDLGFGGQAVGYCSVSYCANQPWDKPCGCPPESDKPGSPSNCGTWTWSRVCWDGPVASSVEAPECPAIQFPDYTVTPSAP